MGEGDPMRIVILFERCLVACALYEDFWIRYAEYLETQVQKVMDRKSSENVNVDNDMYSDVAEVKQMISGPETIKEETNKENSEPEMIVSEHGSEESKVSEVGNNNEIDNASGQEIIGDKYSASENVTASPKEEREVGIDSSCTVQSVGIGREVNNIVDDDNDDVVISESVVVVPRSGAGGDDDMVMKDKSGGGQSQSTDTNDDDARFVVVVCDSQTNMTMEQPQPDPTPPPPTPTPPEGPDTHQAACNITEIISTEQSDKETIEQVDEQQHIDTETPEGNDNKEIECVDSQGDRLESISVKGDENTYEREVLVDDSSDDKLRETAAVNPSVCTETANATENEPSQVESVTVTLEQLWYDLCVNLGLNERVLKCPPLTPQWLENGVSWEDVRHIYRRGVWIHCPNKPTLLMKWAEFEETQGKEQDLRGTVCLSHLYELTPSLTISSPQKITYVYVVFIFLEYI